MRQRRAGVTRRANFLLRERTEMQKFRMGCRYAWRMAAGSVAAAALLLADGPGAFGQATTATLVGTVTDTSGAALSQATVKIVNQNTGQTYAHQTNESG